MRKRLYGVFIIAGICVLSAETKIQSIYSEDLSPTVNKIYITLSDSSQYSVHKLNEGNGVRVIFNNVEGKVKPLYPRLSTVLDKITCYSVANNVILDINTMGDYPVNSYFESGKNLITLTINAEGAVKAMPSKFLSKAEKSIATERVSQSVVRQKIIPNSENSDAELDCYAGINPDIQSLDSLNNNMQLSTIDTVAMQSEIEGSHSTCPIKSTWDQLKYIILSVIAVVCLFFLFKCLFKKKAQNKGKVTKSGEENSLLLPPETAKLMIEKLLDKDWKPEEIARELHLNLKEVNKIISAIKKEQND